MSDFVSRRLSQLKPIGATMVTKIPGTDESVMVSTIRFGDGNWTRVEHQLLGTYHYRGDVSNTDAVAMFMLEVSRVA